MESINENEICYREAEKKVKRIKNFYVFALVYIVVNAFILLIDYRHLNEGETIWHFKNFLTAIFWGIGLVIYGMNIFLPGFIFGSQWEEKKIRQLMNNDK